ncbi:MAG: zinc carboxypeptidase [Hydrogenophilales bacterium 28-61-23]|nr:MAG: zinc carboxypeptidase [Hydrogenophilales bacterium 28-61-23]
MYQHLPELIDLNRLLDQVPDGFSVRVAHTVEVDGTALPIHVLALGNPDPNLPAIGYFGGIHGLERIGTRVLLVYLRGLLNRLKWDPLLHRQLETLRMVFVPLANPGGMWRNTRSNPDGVDLMRNAPLDALERVPFMLGGQRYSARLPWYRGPVDAPMQPESQVLARVVEEELGHRRFSLAMDCHSGFGVRDRIWFPYAHTTKPFPNLPEVHALKDLFEQSFPTHNYVIEPQSRQYLAHGDLWDHFYLQTRAGGGAERVFLPLTLEMGSWLWVKKNPRQLFSRQGLFNPRPGHRMHRILRQHLLWLDFLARAAGGWENWLPRGDARLRHKKLAMAEWYGWHHHS